MNEPINDALQTKCKTCGGIMSYSPAQENLKCLYCGFITELYQSDFRESLDDAKKKMETVIDEAIRKDIGGDKQHINSKNTEYNDLKFKHLLLPVWISAFKFNSKLYQFVVNGRTGQVVGEYPKSMAKIVSIVLAIIAVIGALYYLMG